MLPITAYRGLRMFTCPNCTMVYGYDDKDGPICKHCKTLEVDAPCLICGTPSHTMGRRYSVIEKMYVPYYPLCESCQIPYQKRQKVREGLLQNVFKDIEGV